MGRWLESLLSLRTLAFAALWVVTAALGWLMSGDAGHLRSASLILDGFSERWAVWYVAAASISAAGAVAWRFNRPELRLRLSDDRQRAQFVVLQGLRSVSAIMVATVVAMGAAAAVLGGDAVLPVGFDHTEAVASVYAHASWWIPVQVIQLAAAALAVWSIIVILVIVLPGRHATSLAVTAAIVWFACSEFVGSGGWWRADVVMSWLHGAQAQSGAPIPMELFGIVGLLIALPWLVGLIQALARGQFPHGGLPALTVVLMLLLTAVTRGLLPADESATEVVLGPAPNGLRTFMVSMCLSLVVPMLIAYTVVSRTLPLWTSYALRHREPAGIWGAIVASMTRWVVATCVCSTVLVLIIRAARGLTDDLAEAGLATIVLALQLWVSGLAFLVVMSVRRRTTHALILVVFLTGIGLAIARDPNPVTAFVLPQYGAEPAVLWWHAAGWVLVSLTALLGAARAFRKTSTSAV